MGVFDLFKRGKRAEKTKAKKHTLKIAWVLPDMLEGSGGIRTILQRAAYMREKHGARSDIFVLPKDGTPFDEERYAGRLRDWFGFDPEGVYYMSRIPAGYDCVVATSFDTAEYVAIQDCACKMYFVQDYEPMFFAVGDTYLQAKSSYDLGLHEVTLGRWLSAKLSGEGAEVPYSEFGVDASIYHVATADKEDAVCAAFQPDKSRRAPKLMQRALNALAEMNPQVKIYTYGSPTAPAFKSSKANHEHLGIISPAELADLYNKCKAGISFSLTNPSRIPFEMMACGLPVIELDCESTRCDFPSDGVVLSKTTASAVARNVVDLLADEATLQSMGAACASAMEGRSIESENAAFARAMLDCLAQGPTVENDPMPLTPSEVDALFEKFERAASRPLLKASAIDVSIPLDACADEVARKLVEPVFAMWCKDDQSDLNWVKGKRKKDGWHFRADLDKGDGELHSLHLHLYDDADKRRECYAIVDVPFVYDAHAKKRMQIEEKVVSSIGEIPIIVASA